jgi:hypothetical protein
VSRASFKANRAESQARWEVAQLMTPIPPTHPSQMDPKELRRGRRLMTLFGLAASLAIPGGARR